MGLFRKERLQDGEIDAECLGRDVVTDFRQRLHEDPDFRRSFGGLLREGAEKSVEDAALASLALSTEYGDDENARPMPRGVHAARQNASDDICDFLGQLAEEPARPSEEVVRDIRRILGELTRAVYFEGELQVPYSLRTEGAVGMVDPELGLIVIIDRWQTPQSPSE